MIMKRIQIWSMMMLVVMALPIMVACGDDNDNINNNGAPDYTEAEIIELLTGKWEVYGELVATAYETNETFTDNYKGTIEFKTNKSVEFKITDATKKKKYSIKYEGQTYELESYYEEEFVDDYYKYTILKKNGKNYISFGSSSISYAFEIVSLTKTTFMLRLDDEIINKDNKSKPLGHVYMTMVSN